MAFQIVLCWFIRISLIAAIVMPQYAYWLR